MDVHNTLSFVVVVRSSIIVVGTLERYLKKKWKIKNYVFARFSKLAEKIPAS